MVSAPFADFTWRHARRLAAESGSDATEAEVAWILHALLTRAEHGPDKTDGRSAAEIDLAQEIPAATTAPGQHADVIPFGVFDADAKAERWLLPGDPAPSRSPRTRRRSCSRSSRSR